MPIGQRAAQTADTRGIRTVLVAHPSPDLYGSDRMLVESVTGLVAAGWRTVVTIPTGGALVAVLVAAGAEVEICETPVLRKSALRPAAFAALTLSACRSLRSGRRLLRRVRPTVVLVNTVTIPGWTILARASGLPVVVHVHEAEESIPRVLRSLLALPQSLATTIIVNSRATGAVLTASLPMLRSRIQLIYNGVPGPEQAGAGRKVAVEPVQLVFVGRLSPRKGPDLAVEAVRQLRAGGRRVELDLVGAVFEGYEWYEKQLVMQVHAAGLDGAVRFRGFTDPVWPSYEKADIAVCPSRDSEPFGNVSVEAQLARRPVVVTAVQGLVETVEHGRRGVVVPPDDPAALAAAIAGLLDNWSASTVRAETAAVECRRLFDPQRYRDEIVAAVAAPAASRRRAGDGGAPRPKTRGAAEF